MKPTKLCVICGHVYKFPGISRRVHEWYRQWWADVPHYRYNEAMTKKTGELYHKWRRV